MFRHCTGERQLGQHTERLPSTYIDCRPAPSDTHEGIRPGLLRLAVGLAISPCPPEPTQLIAVAVANPNLFHPAPTGRDPLPITSVTADSYRKGPVKPSTRQNRAPHSARSQPEKAAPIGILQGCRYQICRLASFCRDFGNAISAA